LLVSQHERDLFSIDDKLAMSTQSPTMTR